MQYLVVDSSVIVKWLNQLDEKLLDKADKVLATAQNGKYTLIAPELAKYEIGNALLRKQLNAKEVKKILHTFYSLPISFISDSEILSLQTYALSQKFRITYYDAAFVAMAQMYNATLVTDNYKHQGKVSTATVVPLQEFS